MSAVVGHLARSATVFQSCVAGAACFLIPAALVTAYTLNHFYVVGAYFWDSGLFAHFSAFTNEWPMQWPTVLPYGTPRPTFFSIHFMPIFYLSSALHQLVPFVPPAAYFAILQGMWAGLIGLSAFLLCAGPAGYGIAAVTALATALCGPMLAAIGFPHVETAIPALLLLFFALHARGHVLAAFMALGLCLLVREDAGLHAAAFLTLLAAARWISGYPRQESLRCLAVALVCVAWSIAVLIFQATWSPGGPTRVETMYLGTPIGAHLSLKLVSARAALFLTGWGYAVWPVVGLFAVAAWRRDALLLAGALAPMPWILLSLLAVKDIGLTSYYSFPIIISIAWPTMAMPGRPFAVRLQLVLAAGSALLFALAGGPNHDKAPWRLFTPSEFGAMGRYEAVLREVVGQRAALGRVMLDDAALSLIPEAALVGEWTLLRAASEYPYPDIVIHMPGSPGEGEGGKVIEGAGLAHHCRIGGTPFVISSRSPLSPGTAALPPCIRLSDSLP